MKKYFPPLLIVAALLFAGCGDDKPKDPTRKLSAQEMWDRAGKEQTIAAYEAYLAAYPNASPEKTQQAREILRELWDKKVKTLTASDMEKLAAVIETEKGTIRLKFFPLDAPNTTRNFIKLAQSHFYDGLTFHRVIDGYIIQGGCPDGSGFGGPGYTILAELNDRPHLAGTLAMARHKDDLDSAGSQFYITLSPQPQLDGEYTVFGEVVEGMETVESIAALETDPKDKPLKPPVIKKLYVTGFE